MAQKFNKYGANHKNELRTQLKKELDHTEEFIKTLTNKFGVFAVFHFENGEVATLRAISNKEDAEDVSKQTDKDYSLHYLCTQAKNENLVKNNTVATILLGYAYQTNSYQTIKNFQDYNKDIGMIIHFFINNNEFACRQCVIKKFDDWNKVTKEIQLEGHPNVYYEGAMSI